MSVTFNKIIWYMNHGLLKENVYLSKKKKERNKRVLGSYAMWDFVSLGQVVRLSQFEFSLLEYGNISYFI